MREAVQNGEMSKHVNVVWNDTAPAICDIVRGGKSDYHAKESTKTTAALVTHTLWQLLNKARCHELLRTSVCTVEAQST